MKSSVTQSRTSKFCVSYSGSGHTRSSTKIRCINHVDKETCFLLMRGLMRRKRKISYPFTKKKSKNKLSVIINVHKILWYTIKSYFTRISSAYLAYMYHSPPMQELVNELTGWWMVLVLHQGLLQGQELVGVTELWGQRLVSTMSWWACRNWQREV